MFGLAARHDAMPSNPVRDTARLSVKAKMHRTLTLEEVWDLRAKIAADQKAIDWDLVDLVDMMLATGLRIGETAAITWPSLDLEAGTVEVRGTVIRITGKGLIIKLKPKSKAGWRIIELPSWAVAMLKRRQAEQDENEWEAVFTSPSGTFVTRATRRVIYATSSTGPVSGHHLAHVPPDRRHPDGRSGPLRSGRR
jgi:integrase